MTLDRDLVRRLGSSRFNYWFGYVANGALVVWLLTRALPCAATSMTLGKFTAYGLAGLFTWTLSEYVLHRFVYHEWASFLSQGHDLHHKDPRALIGVPWYLSGALVLTVYYLIGVVTDFAATGVVMGFAWLGYIGYCLAHHGSHHWRMRMPWLRHMKRHHQLHHAHPEYNWGFTTTLWDIVFRTYWQHHRLVRGKHLESAG